MACYTVRVYGPNGGPIKTMCLFAESAERALAGLQPAPAGRVTVTREDDETNQPARSGGKRQKASNVGREV